MNLSGFSNVIETRDFKSIEHFIEHGKRHSSFYGLAGESCFIDLCNERDYLDAYNNCSPLKSIIAGKSKAFNSGRVFVKNRNTGKEVKSGIAKTITDLLKKPNPLQRQNQFFIQQNIYVEVFGYCPVLKINPAGMPDEISSVWNIPPWLFDIEYTKKWLQQTDINQIYDSYWINWNGVRAPINKKNLSFIFDDGIGTEDDTNLTIPDSRLKGLSYEVSNIIAAYKSRNTLITKRGAIGILSNRAEDADGATAIMPNAKEDLQKQFGRYGLTGQAYQIIITDANLEWQQMGFPTKDLMLFEEIEDDIYRICDAYGYKSVLLATTKNTTYENQNTARKSMYEETIIPESAARMEQFSDILMPDDTNNVIDRDFSHLAVLQEDKVQAAIARNTLDTALQVEYTRGLITKNDWREKLGDERLSIDEDPTGDDYFDAEADRQAQTNAAIQIAQAKGKAKQPIAA